MDTTTTTDDGKIDIKTDDVDLTTGGQIDTTTDVPGTTDIPGTTTDVPGTTNPDPVIDVTPDPIDDDNLSPEVREVKDKIDSSRSFREIGQLVKRDSVSEVAELFQSTFEDLNKGERENEERSLSIVAMVLLANIRTNDDFQEFFKEYARRSYGDNPLLMTLLNSIIEKIQIIN